MIHWWWKILSEPLPAALFLLALAALWVARKRRGGRALPLPPGPRGLPIVGYLPFLDPKAPHRSLAEMARKVGGGVVGVWLGSVYSVVVSDPVLVRDALSREEFAGRAPLYLTHGIMKGHGIICAEGERWKTSRRFAASFLKTLGMVRFPGPRRDALERRIMVAVEECLEGFRGKAKKIAATTESVDVELDPLPELLHGMGNLMSDLVFGKKWKRDDPTWRWLQSLQEEGTKLIGVAGPLNFLPFLRFLPYYKKTIRFLMEGKDKTHALYRRFILEHVESRRRSLEERESGSSQEAGLEVKGEGADESIEGADKAERHEEEQRPQDAIEAFLVDANRRERRGDTSGDDHEVANDTQLHHLLADIFGAGLDTTMATLRWFLLLVAVNPHVQDLVQEELDSVLGAPGSKRRAVTIEDSANMPYTEATIAETQRIRPVVPLGIPHGALKDTTLGGFRIPQGTMLVPLQWLLHNRESVWGTDAEKNFDPTRFIDSDGSFSVRRMENFMPFQSGRRVCVGEDLAHMFLLLFGVSIVHEFRLSLAPGSDADDILEGECGITLTPKSHRLVFHPRFTNGD